MKGDIVAILINQLQSTEIGTINLKALSGYEKPSHWSMGLTC